MVGFFNSLGIAAAIEETRPEDRCGQGPEAFDSGYVDMPNRLCMINSLPSAIGGLSTTDSVCRQAQLRLSTAAQPNSWVCSVCR